MKWTPTSHGLQGGDGAPSKQNYCFVIDHDGSSLSYYVCHRHRHRHHHHHHHHHHSIAKYVQEGSKLRILRMEVGRQQRTLVWLEKETALTSHETWTVEYNKSDPASGPRMLYFYCSGAPLPHLGCPEIAVVSLPGVWCSKVNFGQSPGRVSRSSKITEMQVITAEAQEIPNGFPWLFQFPDDLPRYHFHEVVSGGGFKASVTGWVRGIAWDWLGIVISMNWDVSSFNQLQPT